MFHLSQTARKCMLLVVCVAGLVSASAGQFEARTSFLAFPEPSSVVVGDFNHDGRLDLAATSIDGTNGFGTKVQVFLGNGDGTFRAPVNYTVGTAPLSVATADLNHDGNLDLIVANGNTNNVSVLLGRGDGTFFPATNFDTLQIPVFVGVADFNSDGKLDLITLHQSYCHCVAVLLGNGDGTFQEPAIVTNLAYSPSAIGVGYFNGDKLPDIAVTEFFGGIDQVEILLGNGDGTFLSTRAYTVSAEPVGIVVGDFNGDKRADLAIAADESNSVNVLLGNGDGTFGAAPALSVNYPLWVAATDFNGDGKSDLVAANLGLPSGVTVLLGNGDGTFQTGAYYPFGGEDRFVTVGDVNGDRKPDIVIPDFSDNRIIVVLNTGVVTFSPTTPLNFKKVTVGTTSSPQTVTLTNTGKSALTISSMKTTGQFGMTSTCGSSVAAGANCAISVTFSPTSTGLKSGTVTLHDSASSKPMVIELSGTGD